MPTTASNKIYFRVDDDNEICIEPNRWYTYLDEHDLLEMLGALHPKKESQDSGISVKAPLAIQMEKFKKYFAEEPVGIAGKKLDDT